MAQKQNNPRINVAIAREVHQAVKEVLERDETLVSFIETRCMEEVVRRLNNDFVASDPGGIVTGSPTRSIIKEKQQMQTVAKVAPFANEVRKEHGMHMVMTPTPLLAGSSIKVEPALEPPRNELEAMKAQLAELTALVRDQRLQPTPLEELPSQEAVQEAVDREAFPENPPEMVVSWDLVPQNVPDGARLINEADDEGRPGVCVQFWRLPNRQPLRTSTRGSVMVPAEEPAPGGPKPSGNAPSGGFPAEDAGFDSTLNTPGVAGPLSPVLPARTAQRAAPEPEEEQASEGDIGPLVSRAAHVNAAGRKVRPSDPTRSQATRIQMINSMVDGARQGSNAPAAAVEQQRPTTTQPGNPTPPTKPAVRKPAAPAPRPAKSVPRASFA